MLSQKRGTSCHVAGELTKAEEEDANAEVEACALETALRAKVEAVVGHLYEDQTNQLASFSLQENYDVL